MRRNKSELLKVVFREEVLPLEKIVCKADSPYKDKELKKLAARFVLDGEPTLSVNYENGEYTLLAGEKDYYALIVAGAKTANVRVYSFEKTDIEMFIVAARIKEGDLSPMDEAYLMKRLVSEFGLTQETAAALTGYSRPAVANTLRLLTLTPEVVGLIESGELTAGHARALVKVPKEKQYAFAEEAIKREYSVREMERAVKAYLTPPEILQKENEAKAAAKSEELKAFVERMRGVFRTKVSLIGNDKKGRIYIDYYSAEDLYRFEEFLDMIESFERD